MRLDGEILLISLTTDFFIDSELVASGGADKMLKMSEKRGITGKRMILTPVLVRSLLRRWRH